MADLVKHILAKPIQLADQVIKAADEAKTFKQECKELKSKTEKLATLFRQAARASSDLYERPTCRIIEDTQLVLDKTLTLVLKCRANGIMKLASRIIPGTAFRKISSQLENSIGDVSWLLRVSASTHGKGREYLGLPPIAANEPILYLIWEQVALLYTGLADERADAAVSLVSLAGDNDRYGKLIIEEGGVVPLLKLLKEGKLEGQENAAKVIGLLGKDVESVECMVQAGVCSVFANVLKESSMKVQAVVAWAISELVAIHPKCQDVFLQHNIVRLLVSHLAFEIIQEHSKYDVVGKGTSIQQVVAKDNAEISDICRADDDDGRGSQSHIPHPLGNNKYSNQMHDVVANTMAMKTVAKPPLPLGTGKNCVQPADMEKHQPHYHLNSSSSGVNIKGRESEDPVIKANMKAMAARALWHLAKDNSSICRSITESRALLCFAVLLQNGTESVRYNSVMALLEITTVAEKDPDLRRLAFKPNSASCKAVVEQLLKIIENADTSLLIPVIKIIGNLARTFRATETRMIAPLVRFLDDIEADESREASISLAKFACTENYLHVNHSNAIIKAHGARHLVQLVYFGKQNAKLSALVLLSYIAQHVPDSEELGKNQVLSVLEWASKQSFMGQSEKVEKLVQDAITKVELYQSRGSRRF